MERSFSGAANASDGCRPPAPSRREAAGPAAKPRSKSRLRSFPALTAAAAAPAASHSSPPAAEEGSPEPGAAAEGPADASSGPQRLRGTGPGLPGRRGTSGRERGGGGGGGGRKLLLPMCCNGGGGGKGGYLGSSHLPFWSADRKK